MTSVSRSVRFLACGLVTLCWLTTRPAVAGSTTPPPYGPSWQRDFSTPLEEDESFLILGFGADRQFSSSLLRSVDNGYLTVSDPRLPREGGSFAAIGFDAMSVFDDTRVTGTINLAGIPDPPPPTSGPGWENEIGMGLLARGDLIDGNAYVGGINFLTGEPFILLLTNRMIYEYDVRSGASLADDIPDFKSRSFYLQFDTRSNYGFESGSLQIDSVDLKLSVYNQPGGTLLSTVDWSTQSVFGPGLAGIFASFRDAHNPEVYPPLFASFDDVAATVPEPPAVVLAGIGVVACVAVRRRRW